MVDGGAGRGMNNTVERLRASRMRVTSGRIFVLQAIERSALKKLRVEDIFRELVDNGTPLSLGSVYRVLKELTREGLLVRVWDHGGDEQKFSSWMQADATPAPSHAMACRGCGRCVPIDDVRLVAQLRRAGERAGLAMSQSALTIQVLCRTCAQERHMGNMGQT